MGKALGCGAAGIVGLVIWIITVLIIVFMFLSDVANSLGTSTGRTDDLNFEGILIGGFILGLIPIGLGIIFASKEGDKDSKKLPTSICGKCNNKSTDFDGLFCPNCGAKFSTKTKDNDEFGLF
ncbi:MAG: hypothetical protein FI718_00125 [SAR202 cluster bacterium]|nr:hypothetical protein [SAR202 cluster bacterium]|tara:strand:- start:1836 stop:2204 length:369 start_codon:yes stop_codon:yes gene_type:complete